MTLHANAVPSTPGRLSRAGDRILYRAPDGSAPVGVKIRWARPLSGRNREVSLCDAEKKVEILILESLEALDPDSRTIANEELERSLALPRIVRIRRADPRYGNRYWWVDTDRGPAHFLMGSPETHVIYPSPDRMIVKDVMGNVYEIFPVSGLDARSLAEMDKVI